MQESVNIGDAERVHAETRDLIAGHHEETRSVFGSIAFDVVDALEARLESRGSTIDAAYLVEIGVARLEIVEVDGALRRGVDVDARRTLGRMDDLLRRLEGSIVKGATRANVH